jgi:excisionase family DNA binding protein
MPPMRPPARRTTERSLPLQAVAQRWQVPRRVVRRLLQQGQLPFEQVAGQLRVPLGAVQEYERSASGEVRSGAHYPPQDRITTPN